jgi:hypothetical protein
MKAISKFAVLFLAEIHCIGQNFSRRFCPAGKSIRIRKSANILSEVFVLGYNTDNFYVSSSEN